jgi:uncharacterized protein
MKKSLVSFVLTASMVIGPVMAQPAEKFTIAGGGGIKEGSTYSSILGTLAETCSTDELPLAEVNTNGGVTNLSMLRDNKVKAAVIPTSVLFASKMENATAVANIRTVVALHPEQVHLVARADTKTEGGVNLGKFNLGGDKITYNKPEDLRGRQVGAVGGSVVDARIISDLLKIGWTVREFPKTSEMVAALTSGTVDAAIFVAGSPSGAVAGLPSGRFKLLPIRGNADTATVYSAAKVQYENMNLNAAVDTLSQQALLVTRTWRSPEMLDNISRLRSCFYSNLARIQDKTGTHAAWQTIKDDEQGKWAWYDLPKVAAAPAPVAPPVAAQKPAKK